MWHDSHPEVIDADFAPPSGLGIDVLRILPLWPDFQPIHSLKKWRGLFVEHRHGELPLGGDDADIDYGGVFREMQLWGKVAAGATLYLSLDDCTQ
jgi:hypothetical protein